MRKKKKDDDNYRCYAINLKFEKDSLKPKVINFQMLNSKNVYNSGVFFCRRWYDCIQIICQYYIDNLDKYKDNLTTRDCSVLLNYSLRKKYFDKVKELYEIYTDTEQFNEYVANREDMKELLKAVRQLKVTKKGRMRNVQEVLSSIQMIIDCNSTPFMSDSLSQLKLVLKTKMHNVLKNKGEIKGSSDDRIDLIPPIFLGLDYMDLFVKQNIPSYRYISSQVSQQTLKKVEEAYESFFETNLSTAKPPDYNKTNKFNLLFQSESFKVEKGRIRLSLGLGFVEEFKKIHLKFSDDCKENKYLYLNLHNKLLKKNNITEVEIVPSQYKDRDIYKLVLKYKISLPDYKPLDNLQKMSIDLGMVNLATV